MSRTKATRAGGRRVMGAKQPKRTIHVVVINNQAVQAFYDIKSALRLAIQHNKTEFADKFKKKEEKVVGEEKKKEEKKAVEEEEKKTGEEAKEEKKVEEKTGEEDQATSTDFERYNTLTGLPLTDMAKDQLLEMYRLQDKILGYQLAQAFVDTLVVS